MSALTSQTHSALCSECGAQLNCMADVMVGEILNCADCSSELEVLAISGSNISVALAPEEEEDWGE